MVREADDLGHVGGPRHGDAGRLRRRLLAVLFIVAAGLFGCRAGGEHGGGASWHDATRELGLSNEATTFDLVTADYDADGDDDLLVINHRSSPWLLQNQGHGVWWEVAEQAGLVSMPDDLAVLSRSDTDPSAPGYSLWHAPEAYGPWFLGWRGDAAVEGKIVSKIGLYDVHLMGTGRVHVEQGGDEVRYSAPAGAKSFTLSFKPEAVGGIFDLHLTADGASGEREVHVGTDGRPMDLTGRLLGIPDNHRACWLDADGDGDLDLYLSRGANRRHAVGWKHNALFIQEDGRFVDRARELGVEDSEGSGRGVATLDMDNDGWMDLVVVNYLTPSAIYRNLHGTGFREVGEEMGVAALGSKAVREVAVADYDGDGYSDLLIAGRGAFLLHNDGGRHFTQVAELLGRKKGVEVAAVHWADWDGDGDPDLYVARQGRLPGFVWHAGGEVRFDQTVRKGRQASITVAAPRSGLQLALYLEGQRFDDAIAGWANPIPGEPVAGSPTTWHGACYAVTEDEKGIRITLDNHAGEKAVRFSGVVTSEREIARPGTSGFALRSWGAVPWRHRLREWSTRLPSRSDVLLENLGDGRFRDVTLRSHVRGQSHDVAFADFDHDGDLDLFRLCNRGVYGEGGGELLLNDGTGRFSVNMRAPMVRFPAVADKITAIDADQDGWPDIFATFGGATEPGLGRGPYVLLLNPGDQRPTSVIGGKH